ncbi:DUF1206 domain-containing protein [Streptomyces sp. B15]|uniref:DUF1206 domain-containing protein n=1 Tax=Streptomyces sp. B15 TaxID=1537797 RepID=UPI001B38951F|nr:DUF1206 domain-containing protein [Streptomyces sp. B15]MBQ1121726.1 DUF1206 domain-containing protein [Streptomyces sp. B15]
MDTTVPQGRKRGGGSRVRWAVPGRARASDRARATARPVLSGAARAGFLGRGVSYLLVGALAVQVAFADGQQGGGQADRGGALREVAGRPFGAFMLWALGLALAGMALWRLSEAVWGAAEPGGHMPRKRLASGARGLFYVGVAYSVLAFAAGDKGSGSGASDRRSRDVTAELLGLPAGQWVVGVGGGAVVVAGLVMACRAALRKYHDQLRMGRLSERQRKFVDVTGVLGGLARGLVFATVGAFLARAALTYDPERAKGLDDTLRSFTRTPAGPWLLVAVAAGLLLFGVFSFAVARWRRT